MIKKTICTLVTLLLLWTVFELGCGGSTQISGSIVDGDGKPIGGAEVRLKDPALIASWYSVNSGTDGSFSTWHRHRPRIKFLEFSVFKSGFRIEKRKVITKDNPKLRIVLERGKPNVEKQIEPSHVKDPKNFR